MKYFWVCPICHSHGIKPLLHYHASRDGRRHIIDFHGTKSVDPILVPAEFRLESLGIVFSTVLFPLGPELFPFFSEPNVSIFLKLTATVLILFRLFEELFYPQNHVKELKFNR